MVSVGIAARRRRRARASGCGRARRGIRPRRAGGQSRPSRDANRGRVVGVLKPNSRHVDRTSHSYTRGAARAPRATGRRVEAASTRAPARHVGGYTLLGPPPLLARLTPAPVSMVAVDGSPLTRSAEVRSSRSGGGSPLPRKPPPPVGEIGAMIYLQNRPLWLGLSCRARRRRRHRPRRRASDAPSQRAILLVERPAALVAQRRPQLQPRAEHAVAVGTVGR